MLHRHMITVMAVVAWGTQLLLREQWYDASSSRVKGCGGQGGEELTRDGMCVARAAHE